MESEVESEEESAVGWRGERLTPYPHPLQGPLNRHEYLASSASEATRAEGGRSEGR